jgi:hypothetical protein
VDPRNRTVDAYALVGGNYQLAVRLEDNEARGAPPFLDLMLDPMV